jgi:hypothetical protein
MKATKKRYRLGRPLKLHDARTILGVPKLEKVYERGDLLTVAQELDKIRKLWDRK